MKDQFSEHEFYISAMKQVTKLILSSHVLVNNVMSDLFCTL